MTDKQLGHLAAVTPQAKAEPPVPRRLVDLSAPIVASPPGTPDVLRTEIAFEDHSAGASVISELLGVPRRLLRNEEGWANEFITRLGTHNATHVDAPYHYNSTIQGRPADSIDQVPLDWFLAPGVVLDFHDRADGETIEAADIDRGLTRAGHILRERDIVLVRTDRDRFLTEPDYMIRGPGVSAEATRWLFDRGVRVMGIDAWGWDRPLHLQAHEALERQETGIFWAAHQINRPYSQIERLSGLGGLPSTGFVVACFPLRIVGAGAAPARVVAIVGDCYAA